MCEGGSYTKIIIGGWWLSEVYIHMFSSQCVICERCSWKNLGTRLALYFVLINPRRACAGGLQYLSCVCITCVCVCLYTQNEVRRG